MTLIQAMYADCRPSTNQDKAMIHVKIKNYKKRYDRKSNLYNKFCKRLSLLRC